jgi:hypothetical protein
MEIRAWTIRAWTFRASANRAWAIRARTIRAWTIRAWAFELGRFEPGPVRGMLFQKLYNFNYWKKISTLFQTSASMATLIVFFGVAKHVTLSCVEKDAI